MVSRLGEAEVEIKILQTWISNWVELWLAMYNALQIDETGEPRSHVRIRIILVNPQSDLCRLRGEHSGIAAEHACERADTSVRRVVEFKRAYNLSDRHLQIRLSEELPTFALFATEKVAFFNPYLRQRITYASPCFIFAPVEDGFENEVSRHFEQLWEKLPRYA
jgi:hypothetical protein